MRSPNAPTAATMTKNDALLTPKIQHSWDSGWRGWFVRVSPLSSLLPLTLIAFGLVLGPVVVMLVTATNSVEQLARQSESTVLAAARTVDAARAVGEQAPAMERHARQYEVLREEQYAALYAARRADFLAAVDQLAALSPSGELAERLEALRVEESGAHAVLVRAESRAEERAVALEALAEVSRSARGLLGVASEGVSQASAQVQDDASALQRQMVRQATLVVPVVLLVVLAAGLLIVRPIRQLDASVRRIGAGELDTPVRMGGPADLRALGERLEWLRTRLISLEADRTRLFRHVSHELKTPLACIREGTELLSDGVGGEPTPEQRELLDILTNNTNQLQRRIEDILHISAIRQGDTRLEVVALDLRDEVAAVLRQHEVPARSLGVALSLDGDPARVRGDRHKLRTVVDNLVTNALKFTPGGGGVRLSINPRGEDVVLDVVDEGPGFSEAEAERVFEAFYQGSASLDGGVRGTGLGLTIAREYARAHGGELRVLPGQPGGRLRFTLPLSEAASL